MDNKGELILNSSSRSSSPFGYGAGHIYPTRALNPGLVYDLGDKDYLDFLCALKYNATVMAMAIRSIIPGWRVRISPRPPVRNGRPPQR